MSRLNGPYKADYYTQEHWIEGPGISPAFLNGWATMSGHEVSASVAAALNIAYEEGREALRSQLKELLNIEEADDLK